MTTKITGDNIDSIANTGVTWNAVTVADGSTTLNASAGNGYFLDTNTGVIEVILPSSPTRGDTIILADYAGNFSTNNVIVRAGSNLIDSVETAGAGQGYVLETNNLIVELVYVDSTKGWMSKENEAKSDLTAATDTNAQFVEATGGTITTSGNFKIHTFTGDGCFVVSNAGCSSGSNTVDYLVVAGGGSGSAKGPGDAGGGGGAGGFRYSNSTFPVACAPGAPLASSTGLPVSATTFPVSVGGGGAGHPNPGGPCAPNGNGSNGSNSVFSTITSTGGGKGGYHGTRDCGEGAPGGSGGGAMSGTGPGPTIATGAGNTPPVSPPQGNPGGTFSYGGSSPNSNAAGGGGAISAAPNSTGGGSSYPGGAGAGLPTAFGTNGAPCGSFRYYSGGGGAGAYSQAPAGGIGGGGGQNTAGTANTGGGGGGGANGPGSKQGYSGGKGIVVIRYKFQPD